MADTDKRPEPITRRPPEPDDQPRGMSWTHSKLDVEEILKDLSNYRPRRRGWTWRRRLPYEMLGPFDYRQTSEGLRHSIPLPAAQYFGNIDPQPTV